MSLVQQRATANTELSAIPTYGDERRLAADRREFSGRQMRNRVFLIVRKVLGEAVSSGAARRSPPPQREGGNLDRHIGAGAHRLARVGSAEARGPRWHRRVPCFDSQAGRGAAAERFIRSR